MSIEVDGPLWADIQALRENGVGRRLIAASRRYNDLAITRLRKRGFQDLTPAHASLLPHVDLSGARLTELADRAGMTKQSASELVASLERLGYLRRAPDPADRRAQLVTFTDRGRDFLVAAYDAKRALEAELADRLGAERSADFCTALQAVADLQDVD